MINSKNKLSLRVEESLRSTIDPATQLLLYKYSTPTSRTLEIGCGPGQYRLAVKGEYIGIDLTAADYDERLPRTPDVLADAMSLPFQNNLFDVVFYSNTFYHFDDPNRALLEVMRTLRPNGKIMIFDYSRKTLLRVKDLYTQKCPAWRAYPRTCLEWIALLEDAGFTNVNLQRKYLSFKQKLLHLLHCRWTRSLYFSIIDRFEGSILVVGMKPASSPGE